MNCSELTRLTNEELDGSISPSDVRSLAQHLASCPSCRREHELLTAIDAVLADEPLERAPAWFAESVAAGVARHTSVRRRNERMAVTTACAVGSIAAGYGIFRAINWGAARAIGHRAADAAQEVLSPLASPLADAPDIVSSWSSTPGAVGLAVASTVIALCLLGYAALRALGREDLLRFVRHGSLGVV